mgnify:CR=1 FL=1
MTFFHSKILSRFLCFDYSIISFSLLLVRFSLEEHLVDEERLRQQLLAAPCEAERELHARAAARHHEGVLVFARYRRGRAAVERGHLRDDLADSGAGAIEGFEVGGVVLIHGGGNSDNVEIAGTDLLQIGGADEAMIVDGVLEEFVGDLKGGIMSGHQGIDTLLVHVETDGFKLRGEKAG